MVNADGDKILDEALAKCIIGKSAGKYHIKCENAQLNTHECPSSLIIQFWKLENQFTTCDMKLVFLSLSGQTENTPHASDYVDFTSFFFFFNLNGV